MTHSGFHQNSPANVSFHCSQFASANYDARRKTHSSTAHRHMTSNPSHHWCNLRGNRVSIPRLLQDIDISSFLGFISPEHNAWAYVTTNGAKLHTGGITPE